MDVSVVLRILGIDFLIRTNSNKVKNMVHIIL